MLRGRSRRRGTSKMRRKFVRGLVDAELPSFSASVIRALGHLRTGDKSLSAVGDEVVSDPNCSVRVLRIANSAGTGLRRPVETVPHAASLLGRHKLEVILVAAAVRSSVPTPKTEHFDPTEFWHLAARRATLARGLANRLDPKSATFAFTVGLLQDIAIPLLAVEHGARYGELLAQARADGCDLGALEKEVFGWDHSQVGLDLAKLWSLPDRLAEGIGGHHSAEATAPVSLVASLSEGDGDKAFECFIERAKCELNIPSDETTALVANAEDEAGQLLRALR